MEIIGIVIAVAVGGVGMLIGLDLRKWTSWLYGVCGLLGGLLIGLSRSDLLGGLKVGAIFAFLIMYSGAMVRRLNQRYKE